MEQTRSAIVGSFNELVFERPYREINVSEILGEAGVGRSTFYEHFRNKDELLIHSSSGILQALADAVIGRADKQTLVHQLEHFRENRRMALDLLCGDIGIRLERLFAQMVQSRLEQTAATRGRPLLIAPHLAAAQCAGAMFGLILEWLRSLDPTPSPLLADAIVRTIGATIEQL